MDINCFFKSARDKSIINLVVFPVDEEGRRIDKVLTILKATQGKNDLQIQKDVIRNIAIDDSVLNLKFEINIKKPLSLGVDIYEDI